MVVPNISNPFFIQFMRAFHQTARDRGYSVYIIDTDEDAAEEVRRVEGMLSQVDGIALVSPRMSASDLRRVTGKGRFVVVHRRLEGLACVWVDSRPALGAAFADLGSLGHESVVYVRGPAGGYSDSIRRKIARSLAKTNNIELTFTKTERDEARGAAAAVDLAVSVGATALVVHSDAAAIAIISECLSRGLEVPGDLSVIGHDDINWASVVHPALSTISARTEDTGSWSANALVDLIEGAEPENDGAAALQRSTVAQYVRRASIAAPNGLIPAARNGRASSSLRRPGRRSEP